MNQILRHIEYLVSRHDCVIIPGLGAVLARYCGASYNADSQAWMPPCRRFMFNSALTVDDGLLVNSVSRANSVSHERAMAIVNNDVMAMSRQLRAEGVVSLGRVGELTLDGEGTTVFVPSNRDMLTPGVAWLPLLPAASSENVNGQNTADPDLKVSHGRIWRPVKRAMRVAAAVVLLLGLGLALSTPIKVDEAAFASLGVPRISAPTKAKPDVSNVRQKNVSPVEAKPSAAPTDRQRSPKTIKRSDVKTRGTAISPSDLKNVKKQPASVPAKTSPTTVPAKTNSDDSKVQKNPPVSVRMNTDDEYCLVIASLNTAEGARKFIDMESRRNPGLEMQVLEQGGHFRIYAGTGQSESEALKNARDGRIGRYRGVWVTKR